MDEDDLKQQNEIIPVESGEPLHHDGEVTPQSIGYGLEKFAIVLKYFCGEVLKGAQKAHEDTPPEILNAIKPVKNARISVNVSPSLWAGKTPKAAYDALKAKGMADDLVAYVLARPQVDGSKTDKGKLFLPDGSDDSVYLKKFNGLIERAAQRYTVTFIK